MGGGSFGTALACVMARAGRPCTLLLRDDQRARAIQDARINEKYFPGHRLPDGVRVVAQADAALASAGSVFFVVPSRHFRSVAQSVAPHIKPGTLCISCTKGIEPDSGNFMSEVLAQELGDVPVGALSGPNLADEIMRGQITGALIASPEPALCNAVIDICGTPKFRVYSSTDLRGTELAGTLKNIYAIMAGVGAALQIGANTGSILIARGLAEMTRFGVQMGADKATFVGLAGLGDLIATCSSPLSRNYQIGLRIGGGQSLTQAMDELGRTAEGVNTTATVVARARRMNIPMPLAEGLHAVLFEGKSTAEVIENLMARRQTQE